MNDRTKMLPETIPLHGMIDILFATLDARDPYTFEHSYRVAGYSEIMAERLGLTPEICEKVHYAAHLHDIGKNGIPDRILSLPGQLTDADKKIMQSHACIGDSILKRIPVFKPIADVVRHHHERFDGMGYPDHLKGDEIPVESRIIAIADSFDAMTSTRSYRMAMNFNKALNEIKAHSGDQFDPHIVDIFNECFPLFPLNTNNGITLENQVGPHESILHLLDM